MMADMSAIIANELHGLHSVPDDVRLDARLTRYRRIGL
jgi:acetyl-CoA carboxylase alpha subunit